MEFLPPPWWRLASCVFQRRQMPKQKGALVIGNGAYRSVPEIPNPPNNAARVAAAFLRLGFSVRLITDANYDTMRRALLAFSPKVRGAEVAVVYFAGHGIELEGENWLVPIDAALKTDLDTEQEAISLRAIVLMVSAASQLGLVMLDACRNNPFLAKLKRSIATRGVPYVYGSLSKQAIYLKPPAVPAAPSGPDQAAWQLLRKTTDAAALKRFTALYPESPLRQEAEARIAALETARTAKAVRPGADEITWLMLKGTSDEEALKRFAPQYPSSPRHKDAEAQIAELAAAEAAKSGP